MANGDGSRQEKGRLTGEIIDAADQRFQEGTTVKEALDWLRGKGEKPKEKEAGEEEQGKGA